MTDKELLKNASKAAGIENLLGLGFDSHIPYWLNDSKQPEPRYWNPLIDDGDALRLAVKLRLDLMQQYELQQVSVFEGENLELVPYGDDPYAAMRYAIVFMAAEIGKRMK